MKITLPSLAQLLATISASGGILGVVLVALGVGRLAEPADAVVGALSALLVAIGAWHAASVTAHRASSKPPVVASTQPSSVKPPVDVVQ